MAVELVGDSARGDSFAHARLLVEGDRVLEAEAPGMARSLAGLTLLEAAAVPGETLAADAVANAIAPAFEARPRAGRVAVAMSGGVDSAVALHRAGDDAVGVTLRLWLDPAGPNAERACCSPDAVIKAREACHARGVPHVTLDLREEFRAEVVGSFVRGYESGLTPNPCMRCNGAFRFAALVGFAERAGAAILWTGHYARIAEREGLRLVARGSTLARISRTCSRRSIRACWNGSPFRWATTPRRRFATRPRRPGSPQLSAPRARRRASLPGGTTERSSNARACPRRRGRSSTRRAR